MLFEQNREFFYSQLDETKKVSYETILQFFQDIAVSHTNKSGFTLEKLSMLKKAWILLSMHVRFIRPIKLDSKIKIKTWTYDFSRVCGSRAYEILDKNSDEIFALASAMWTYIDIESGRPAEIPSEMISYFGNEAAPDINYLRRAPSFSKDFHVLDFSVLKRDLDSNNHMNNVKYLGYALEALPEKSVVSEAEVFYKYPLYYKDKVSVYAENTTENTVLLTFENQDEKDCAYIKFILG